MPRCLGDRCAVAGRAPAAARFMAAAAAASRPADAPTMARRAAGVGLPALPANVFNDWGNADLPAAQLYAAAVRPGSSTCVAVGAHGVGGVGTTLACLLAAHRVASEAAGVARFPDGAFWVQLSQTVGDADVTQRMLAVAVAVSGQAPVGLFREFRWAHGLDVAAKHLRAALLNRSCLLIVDDVWEDRWAAVFLDALPVATASCLVFSTRRQGLATRLHIAQSVPVGALHGAAAAGVLLVHAEAGGKVWADKTRERVQLAVAACGGMALALAVMGALVHEQGWSSAVERVRFERDAVVAASGGVADVVDEQKGPLWACLLASYRSLDADEPLLWRARFQALCVVRPKEQLPLTALAALWGEHEVVVVKRIARALRDRSLVTLCGEEGDGTFCLSLHDLLVEFLAGPYVVDRDQRERVHARMVAAYCEHSRVGAAEVPSGVESTATHVAVRSLWRLPSDGFMEHALPRLLCAAGAGGREELLILLFDWRYIAWRVVVGCGGCDVYRMDAGVYLEEGQGASVDVVDCVAAVVERARSVRAPPPLSVLLQLAACEVTERFASRPRVVGGEAAASLLAYLCDTARLGIGQPGISLSGARRLGLPHECRVYLCSEQVRSLCLVVRSCGDVLLVAGQYDGKLVVWAERSGSRLAVLDGHTERVTCLSVLGGSGSGDGGRVVSGSKDHTVRVWDVDGATCVAVLRGHMARVNCVAVLDGGGSGSEGRVVSGSGDGTVRVWEVVGGQCAAVLEGHTGSVMCLAVLDEGASSGGGRVVSGSQDGSLRVWQVDSGQCLAVLQGHAGWVRCLTVVNGGGSGDGRRVVSTSDDGTVRVWDVDRVACVTVLEGHESSVTALAVLDGGEGGRRGLIVSGSDDQTVRVWEMGSGNCVAVLEGHTNWVSSVVVLDGGGTGGSSRVVSGSGDSTVRVWEVDSGKCVAVLDGEDEGWVLCLAVVDGGGRSGGGRVVSGSTAGCLRAWELYGGDCDAVVEGATCCW